MRIRLSAFWLLLSISLAGQQQSNRGRLLQAYSTLGQPKTDHASSTFVTDPMPLVAPAILEDHNISSVLVLVNNSSDNAGGTLHVRDLAGAETYQAHFVLKPHEERDVPVSTMHSGSTPLQYGSIVVLPDKDLKGPSLAGQLLITDRSSSVPAYLDEELAMPSMQGSTTLRAVTDDSIGKPLVAITNLSQQPQKVTIRCLSAEKQESSTAINLPPQSTSLRLACSDAAFTGLASYLATATSETAGRVTGIEIAGDGVAGEIAAFAFAPHKRNSDTVFSSVPFSDPATIHSPDFVFAGVPVGPQPTLPNGVYVPRISLSNFSSKPAHVSVLLSSTPASAEAGGSAATKPASLLSSVTIPPRQTREVLLTGNEAQSGLQNAITVTSDLQPGDIVGKLVSRSDGNLYQIELLAKDKLDIENGGIHPWTIEGDTESHLVLYNHSSRPQKFDVALSNGGVLWDKTYWISPNETREINFNQLIRDHVPDDRKRILPETLKSGVVNWVTPDGGNATGRLMVTSRDKVMARNYSCGNFVVPCQGYFYTVSNFIGVGQAAALFSLGVNFCNSYYPGQCSGNNQGGGAANYYSTSSSTSAIAFNDSNQPYAQEPIMVGVGPGSSGFSETASANSCSVYGYGNGSVDTTADSLPPESSVSDSVDGTLNIDCDSGSCTATSNNTGETSQPVPVHGFPTYGNYCGAGGSGTPIDSTDAACQAHDTCFGNYGIDFNSYRSGNLTQAQIQGAGMCNVNLCNSIRNVNSSSSIPFQQRAAGAVITLVFTFVGPAAAQCNP